MSAEAMVCVVLQKLVDTLKEESLAQSKIIGYEMVEIIKALGKMRILMLPNASQVSNIPLPADDYLSVLYNAEDVVEKFTLALAHQRKALAVLGNYTFFFNNISSCRSILSKLKKFNSQLEKPNGLKQVITPELTVVLSDQHSTFSSEGDQCSSILSALSGKEDEEKVGGDRKLSTIGTLNGSPRAVALETYEPGSPYGRGEILSFSYSNKDEELQIVGIREERLQYCKNMSSFSYREEELGIFGFKDDIHNMVKQLIEDRHQVVLSIVGEVGTGKTTLARAIYRTRDIKRHFEFRAWVSVSRDHTVRDILLTLLKGLSDNLKDGTASLLDEPSLKLKLSEYLADKTYLIVLDGLRSCSMWEDMEDAFRDAENRGKLILTTSSSETMTRMKASFVTHYLKPLNEEDSWNMFLKKAGREHTEPSDIPEMYRQKILEICKGLPLNIVLLGGLLSMKDLSSWFHVLSSGDDSADSVLSMCYDDLSSHLKVCLLYLVLFPKEFDIPVRRLLRLWLAEGFVKLSPTEHFLEDVAQRHFDDLVNRNMIQISKLRSDNSPRRCRVLGVVHDYLLPKARDTSFFYIHNDLACCEEGVGPLGIRRMVEYVGSKRISWKRASENCRKVLNKTENPSLLTFLSSFLSGRNPTKNAIDIEQGTSPSPSPHEKQSINSFNPSLLRSYLSFNVQRKDMPAREVGSLVESIISNGFGLLRVLDLEGVYKPSLPEKLGNLHQLRYLGLRWTFLDSLPQSVGELPYLHTLDIKHTYIDELPDSIWRLKHLRHINLNETRLDMQPRSSLTLLTLWGLYLDEKIPMKNGLYKLLHLRELGITFHLSSGQDDLMDWITKLSALQSLRLRSVDENRHPSKLILKPMSKLERLSHMNLLGNLEKLPEEIEFPPTLKVLTLSISLLKEDPMQTLGMLPCLTVLRLLGQSYTGKEMVCKTGGFSKLRVLKLWMLKELESWQVEEGAMQILKHLNIRSCHKLKSIPTRVLQKRSLEELVLTDMPEELTAQVESHKSVDTSLAVKHWKFPPLPWEEDGSTIAKKP